MKSTPVETPDGLFAGHLCAARQPPETLIPSVADLLLPMAAGGRVAGRETCSRPAPRIVTAWSCSA